MKIEDFLSGLYIRLAEVSETPKLDAQVLLSHVLSKSRAWVLAHPEASLSAEQEELLDALVAQSTHGVPLPYVIGHWEFYGLDFVVTPATLIPRPETELLVERALSWLQERPQRHRAVDVGTGSGCIAVTLAAKMTRLVVLATDSSREALKVAQENAQRHGVASRVQIAQMDLLSATRATFDLVCANLPYIPTQTLRGLRVYGKEPGLALDGGPTGLDLIRKLLQSGKGRLSVGGLMLLEIEATQAGAVKDLIEESFPEGVVNILPDLAGRDRLVTIRKPSD
ncbi:MAG: peptide chain release factor N(5)-glutamine methyltransferase [Anaerolineales bacterium]